MERRNRFLLLLALLMTAATSAWADELTVHDGTETNEFVPFYGYYLDNYTRSEMIYPATELAVMNGADIKSLTFYKVDDPSTGSWGDASFQVYLKEVSSTTLGDSHIGMTDATIVYEGSVDASGGERAVTINFTTAYHYGGGNLLVGIYQTVTGTYSKAFFIGESVTGASSCNNHPSDPTSIATWQRNFLPKTTFTYDAPAVPKHLIVVSDGKDAKTMEQALPYTTTVGELYQAAYGQDLSDMFQLVSLQNIGSTNTSAVSVGALDGANTPVTVNADGKATVVIKFDAGYNKGVFVNVVPPLYVTMKAGTQDADKWTVSTDGTTFGALPIGGLKGDGTETVTLKYNGRLKVKGVTATSEAAPAGPIVNPVVGQVIGTDGKNYDAGSTLPTGVTAVAMIAYLGSESDCTHGLAIALDYVSSNGLSWDNSGSNNDGKTAAEWCSAWNTSKAVTGGTWRLPTITDWQYIIDCGAGGSYSDTPQNDLDYSVLASKLSIAGGTALEAIHWSSTLTGDNAHHLYFYPSFSTASFGKGSKTTTYKVRPVLVW